MRNIERSERTNEMAKQAMDTLERIESTRTDRMAARATVYVMADAAAQLEGAVDRIERLEDALRWYANANHFPHPDYTSRARAALYANTGGQ